jgi:hypothetical protein
LIFILALTVPPFMQRCQSVDANSTAAEQKLRRQRRAPRERARPSVLSKALLRVLSECACVAGMAFMQNRERQRSARVRKLILASVVIAAPMLALGSTSASAFGWYGYGYGGGCGYYAPRAYGYSYYRPAYYGAYYRPRFAYGSFYRPRVWGWRGWGGRGWGWRGWRRW